MPSPAVAPAGLPIVVIGLGAIGRMHVERVLRSPDVMVVGAADPGPEAAAFARAVGIPRARGRRYACRLPEPARRTRRPCMSGVMHRTLAILERLAADVRGVSLATLADDLDIPRSAAHRLLSDLTEHGYVRQSRERGDYVLTTKLVSLGLNYLKHSGVVDLSQPILDRLAESCGELVRLGVVDVDHLTWVALSQGARAGLRYDPDMGIDAKLSCTASGHVWLSTLDEDDAIALLSRQGLAKPAAYGPQAPTSMQAVLERIRTARKQGWAIACETYAHGLNAMATTIAIPGRGAVGVLAISGPSVRLTDAKMRSLVGDLRLAAADIAAASAASPLFDRAFARPADGQPVERATVKSAAKSSARPVAKSAAKPVAKSAAKRA